MAFPRLLQILFDNDGSGPKLNAGILPIIPSENIEEVNSSALPDATVSEKGAVKLGDVLLTIAQTLTDEQKAQIVENLKGTFLPENGGALNGDIKLGSIGNIYYSDDSDLKEITISTQDSGGLLALRTRTDTTNPGGFYIQSRSASATHELVGTDEGDLTWDGHKVAWETFNQTKSGTNYGLWSLMFSNGLKIVMGTATIPSGSTTTVTFPLPFDDDGYAVGLCPSASGFDVVSCMDKKTTTNIVFGKKNLDKSSSFSIQISFIIMGS